jgi:hypothetical protein
MADLHKRERNAEYDHDPLGKSLAVYGSNSKSIMLMVIGIVLGLTGGAVVRTSDHLAHRLAESRETTAFDFAGWGMIVCSMGAMAWGVLGYGSFFEIRRKGDRYSRRSIVTEMMWKEVQDIQVQKKVVVYRGGRHVYWEVDLYGMVETIHLSPGFLRLVSSVTELVQLLKQVSGIEVILPETMY